MAVPADNTAQMSSDVMRDTFKLPKLVGNGFQQEMMRKNFRKRQVMQPLTGPKPAGVDRIPVDFESIKIAKEVHAASDAREEEPISLDRKVLRFTGYFKEGVHESRWETERVRKAVIYYFLEDHTISVSEPREDNSGMSQGCMLKRHQIPKQDGAGGHYTYEDLNVGAIITFYGKTFRLCDCDEFTRDFLETLGVEVHDPIPFPDDTYQSQRATKAKKPIDPEDRNLKAVMECHYSGKRSRLSPEELKAAKQFLKMDGKVLKFKANWDDSEALYGDVRKLTVYYFLADDTLEVTEDYAVNAGRDPFPSFFRRKKCVKPVGKFENHNASLRFAAPEQEHYTDADLYIGAVINVFGRSITLVSCDKFTEEYLRATYGRESTPINVGTKKVAKAVPKPVPPPYNGFGGEEDSLGAWKNLVLKPPRKDVKRLLENRAQMLKFSMRLLSEDPANEVRRFVLTYYLADDTVSIFEPPQRNSGIIGGKFLQRTKVRHSNTNQPLLATDLFIGADVEIHNHKFAVYASDEKSLTLMEQLSEKFGRANGTAVMSKVRAMLLSSQTLLHKAMCEKDPAAPIDYYEFKEMLASLNLDITEHEVLTILRYVDFSAERDTAVTYDGLLGLLFPPHFGESPASVDRPWAEIYAEYTASDDLEKTMVTADETQYHTDVDKAAAACARALVDKYENHQRTLAAALKSEACKGVDSKVGEAEFKKVLAKILNQPGSVAAAGQAQLCRKLLGGSRAEVGDFMTKLFKHATLKAIAEGKQ
eukprot:TRINITY_DN1820_c0_g1_i1.p1 TRINITY_DN1820_c0_g1~~TRINITY_DN1820_c0_g1_i1.p1  ORF type:complete len:786 (+),score=339.00 TRINITY_DN1820_c0_g1_i1:77-2359(+)